SLLERLQLPNAQESWGRLVKLFTPLLYDCARRVGLSSPDASDFVQDVLAVLVERMREITKSQGTCYRSWLRTVTIDCWHRKRQGLKSEAPVDVPDSFNVFEETEYRQYLVRRALELMHSEFHPATWKACWESVVVGRPAEEVAQELGMAINAVHLSKSRVL